LNGLESGCFRLEQINKIMRIVKDIEEKEKKMPAPFNDAPLFLPSLQGDRINVDIKSARAFVASSLP
jgi:hypothetical protein